MGVVLQRHNRGKHQEVNDRREIAVVNKNVILLGDSQNQSWKLDKELQCHYNCFTPTNILGHIDSDDIVNIAAMNSIVCC